MNKYVKFINCGISLGINIFPVPATSKDAIIKPSDARLRLLTSKNDLKSIAQGITRFHKNVRHLGSVDFNTLKPAK